MMDNVAATIRTQIDTLVDTYAERLKEISDYARVPDSFRRELAHSTLLRTAISLESGDQTQFTQFIETRIGGLIEKRFSSEALLQAIAVLEETVMPLVDTVETAKFLWQASAQARTIVSLQTTELLRESESLYSAIVDQATDGVIIIQDNVCQFANEALAEILGYTSQEMVGRPFIEFLTPESRAVVANRAKARLMGEAVPLFYEAKLQGKDGTIKIAEISAGVIQYQGKPTSLGIIRDITERKQTEEALAEEQNLLRILIDTLPDYIYVKDANSRFIVGNAAVGKVMGVSTPDELVGKTDFDFYPEELAIQYHADEQAIIQSGEPLYNREEPLVDPEGNQYWLSTTKVPLRDESGNVVRLVGIGRDITKRKRAEEELVLYREQLEELVEARTVELKKEISERKRTEADLEDRLRELDTLQGAARHEGWKSWRATATLPEGYLYNQADLQPAGDLWTPELGQAAERKSLVASAGKLNGQAGAAVSPLLVHDETIGALGVYDNPERPLTPDELALVEAVSEQVAQALEGARLFQQTQQSSLLLEERVKELNCLNEVGREIEEAPSIPELLQWVTERIPPAMRYQELCQVAIEYEDQIYGQTEAVSLSTQMAHGLYVGGELLGRIYIAYTDKRDFLDEESALLGGIATRLSSYIENQRLIEQVQQRAAELEETTSFLDSVLDNLPVMIFVKEAKELRHVRWNKTGLELIGRPSEEMIGKNDYDFFPQEEAEFFEAKDRETLEKGKLVEIPEEPIQTANGDIRWLYTRKTPVYGADGQPRYLLGISVDITERKQVESELRASEARFRDVVLSSADWIWEVDAQGRYIYCSEQVVNVLGYTVEEVLGRTPFDFMVPAEVERIGPIFGEIVARQQPMVNLENRNLTKDGREVVLLTNGVPVLDEAGNLVGYRGTDQDITERKQAEEALRDSEERFALAVQGSNDGLWDWDIAKGTLYWSPRLKELLGYADDELAVDFEVFASLLHPDDADTSAALDAHLKDRVPYDIEQRMRHKSGDYRWLRVRGQALWDENGQPIRMVGSSSDITERKQAEEALRQSQQQLELILEAAALGTWDLDPRTGEDIVNERAVAMLGYTLDEVEPSVKWWDERTHPDDFAQTEPMWAAHLAGESPVYEAEYRLRTKSGGWAWILDRGKIIERDPEGNPLRVTGIHLDITDRKQAEAERERLLAEVEAAYRQYVQQEWTQFLTGRHGGRWRIEHRRAGLAAEPDDNGTGKAAIEAPIALRGQQIGSLRLEELDPSRKWTAEEKALVEAVSEQLAQTVENLRLFDETRQRASREQLTRQITDKMRAASDVDSIIETGLNELARALGVARTYVKLTTKVEQSDGAGQPLLKPNGHQEVAVTTSPASHNSKKEHPAEVEE